MKITKISAYVVDIPVIEDEKAEISGGRVQTEIVSTIVQIETDEGLVGLGESVPWGSNYLPAYARGVLPGLEEIVPHLMGEDPRAIGRINEVMNASLLGHPYVKSALDMACWDLLGKACGLPLYQLFGGMQTPKPPLQGFLPRAMDEKLLNTWDQLRQYGFTHFCTKLKGDYGRDLEYIHFIGEHMTMGETLIFDVNRGYRLDEAVMIAKMSSGIALCLEQPCETIEECIEVSKRTGIPVMLDECVRNAHDLMRAQAIGPIDALNLKITRLGGLSQMLQLKNLCRDLNIPVFIQDSGATGITAAAVAHLAHSVAPRYLLGVYIGVDEVGVQTVQQPIEVAQRRCWASSAPGLGVEPAPEVLGEPRAVWS